jgi:hypothetical protein
LSGKLEVKPADRSTLVSVCPVVGQRCQRAREVRPHIAGPFVFLGAGTILVVVRSPKQNCPRCNAVQSFRPRRRDTATPEGKKTGTPAVIEVYIRCTVCNWEQVLRKSTAEIEHLRFNEIKLVQRSREQQARYGATNGNTLKLLRLVRVGLAEAKREAGI